MTPFDGKDLRSFLFLVFCFFASCSHSPGDQRSVSKTAKLVSEKDGSENFLDDGEGKDKSVRDDQNKNVKEDKDRNSKRQISAETMGEDTPIFDSQNMMEIEVVDANAPGMNDMEVDLSKVREIIGDIKINKPPIPKPVKPAAVKTYRLVGPMKLFKRGNKWTCDGQESGTNRALAARACCSKTYPAIIFGKYDKNGNQFRCYFECQEQKVTFFSANIEQYPPTAKARILAGQAEASRAYSCYTKLKAHVQTRYLESVPTADASYFGQIRYGKLPAHHNLSTTLHELGHYFGIGTTSQWRKDTVTGKYQGPRAAALHEKITKKPGARFNGGGSHIWPHGMNYAKELTGEASVLNHCRIVEQIYYDVKRK